jgi:hypothetical protein
MVEDVTVLHVPFFFCDGAFSLFPGAVHDDVFSHFLSRWPFDVPPTPTKIITRAMGIGKPLRAMVFERENVPQDCLSAHGDWK